MTAIILDGKALAATIRSQLALLLSSSTERPGLAVVLVGDDPASHVYVRNKIKACTDVGVRSIEHRLPATTSQTELLALIHALNADPTVHGILVQQPFPKQIDSAAINLALDPRKDADGFHPENLGRLVANLPGPRACTPFGVMELLRAHHVPLAGKHAVVLGRSLIVGKPMSLMLLNADATVTMCHARTENIAEHVRRADILVSAVGKTHLVQKEWIKPGAALVDVGMNRLASGALTGDIDPACAEIAGWISPVPGGVGPMTIAMLLKNTVMLSGLA